MKVKLLKKLRKKYSSYFLIKEDPTHELGCNFIVSSEITLPYYARNMESAYEWIREHVNTLMKNYIDRKKGRIAIYNANGEKIN